MVRNLDHRVEAACPINDVEIKKELLDILTIQLNDNVKARLLDSKLKNHYVSNEGETKIKSQVEIYNYLSKKKANSPVHTRFDKKEMEELMKTS